VELYFSLVVLIASVVIYIYTNQRFKAFDDALRSTLNRINLSDREIGNVKKEFHELRLLVKDNVHAMNKALNDTQNLIENQRQTFNKDLSDWKNIISTHEQQLSRMELTNKLISKRQRILRDALVPKRFIIEMSDKKVLDEKFTKTLQSVANQLKDF